MTPLNQIFFPATFEERFIHLGYSNLTVPKPWVPTVKKAVETLERLIWPQWMPMWSKRLIHYLSKRNSIYKVQNKFWFRLENKITKGYYIEQIKNKFGDLRIYLSGGTLEMYYCIDLAKKECSQICEKCGNRENVNYHIMNWVYLLCDTCKEKERTKIKKEYAT